MYTYILLNMFIVSVWYECEVWGITWCIRWPIRLYEQFVETIHKEDSFNVARSSIIEKDGVSNLLFYTLRRNGRKPAVTVSALKSDSEKYLSYFGKVIGNVSSTLWYNHFLVRSWVNLTILYQLWVLWRYSYHYSLGNIYAKTGVYCDNTVTDSHRITKVLQGRQIGNIFMRYIWWLTGLLITLI